MQRFRSSLLAVVGLAVLGGIGVLMNPEHSAAQADRPSSPVVVTNTNANPVPTTGTATVSGTINVASLPPISGNVGISNTPTVNVASLPTISQCRNHRYP